MGMCMFVWAVPQQSITPTKSVKVCVIAKELLQKCQRLTHKKWDVQDAQYATNNYRLAACEAIILILNCQFSI